MAKVLSPWICTKKLSSPSRWNGVVEFGEDTNRKPSICEKPASARLLKPRARATDSRVSSSNARYSGDFSMRLSTIHAPAVSMRLTTSTGSRLTDCTLSGSWLILAAPELYSIRSRGRSEASLAMRGSVSSGCPASM
ncbi:hypothetical protein BN961_00842 [Afipia felis]|uniref:Uncharacterized protein n=1 Tax=Afipia felis TaxID=1035 RepID=A0A090MME8_AFIFE|nr:hypothetical protein BN961_00842 [Afipia felis]